MPSPFPGMDPYLEGEMWQEFHGRLVNQISTQLMPQLQPKYVALLSKRHVLDQPALGIMGPLPERVIYLDVAVTRVKESLATYAVTRAPVVELINPWVEEVPLLSVEIRDVAGRRLVTVIEVLSPVNKRGDGAREYFQRRAGILKTRTHLLEIDLLRGGQRIPLIGELPPAPYYVFLSRVERSPMAEIWTASLRQPLPAVPVPLLHPDSDVALDLQAAVRACFDLVGYERLLDYAGPPPPPDLSPEDAVWVDEVLRQGGWRTAYGANRSA